MSNNCSKRIWIDIDNSPHVLFFRPIIQKLQSLGHYVTITARDYSQSIGLLDLFGMPYYKIGVHPGKNKLKKVIGTLHRASQLAMFALPQKFDVAASHGSRSQTIAAYWLRCPYIIMCDYEYVYTKIFNLLAKRILVPDLIPDESLKNQGMNLDKILKYPGFKEELYIYDLDPDDSIYSKLEIDPSTVIVTLRPPQTAAHYHIHETELIFEAVLNFLCSHSNVTIVILARTREQEKDISPYIKGSKAKLIFPDKAIDGINLVWHSDIMISGGGTMNREAALLGIPTYTMFASQLGALDQKLVNEQKMKKIGSVNDVDKIDIRKRPIIKMSHENRDQLVNFIVDQIIGVADMRR